MYVLFTCKKLSTVEKTSTRLAAAVRTSVVRSASPILIHLKMSLKYVFESWAIVICGYMAS